MDDLTPYQWRVILIAIAVVIGFFWAIIALERASHRARRERLQKDEMAALHSFDDKDGWNMAWDTLRRLKNDGQISMKLVRTQKGLTRIDPR